MIIQQHFSCVRCDVVCAEREADCRRHRARFRRHWAHRSHRYRPQQLRRAHWPAQYCCWHTVNNARVTGEYKNCTVAMMRSDGHDDMLSRKHRTGCWCWPHVLASVTIDVAFTVSCVHTHTDTHTQNNYTQSYNNTARTIVYAGACFVLVTSQYHEQLLSGALNRSIRNNTSARDSNSVKSINSSGIDAFFFFGTKKNKT